MDVANPDWQKFIGQLSQELYEKGVDGFFIDNCDVYYYDPHESIFEGITAILQIFGSVQSRWNGSISVGIYNEPKTNPKNKRILQGARLPFLYFQFP